MDIKALEQEAYKRLDEYVKANNIDVLISLFSGGGDSIAATLLASKHPAFVGCIHVNTKTSPLSEMASKQAIAKMERFGWEYIEAIPHTTYRQYVAKKGFPGSALHNEIYVYLKERPINHALKLWRARLSNRDLQVKTSTNDDGQMSFIASAKKKKITIAFVTGIRNKESQRRSSIPYADKRKSVYWINPILSWSKMQVNKYNANNDVYSVGSSRDGDGVGECDCRCFASTGENERKTNYNDLMKRYTEKLEALARISRELDLIEVEAGMKQNDMVIESHQTKWGWVADKADTRPIAELPLFSICNDCHGQLTEDGRGGVDPDQWLVQRKLELMASKE